MMNPIAKPEFDPAAFDADFFAEYKQQLADISVEEQAAAVLADILTIKAEDGSEKTYEQIRDDSRTFFASEWVQRDEALMNQLAAQFAMACMSHNHGSELAQDSQLGTVFETGVAKLGFEKPDHNDHSHGPVETTHSKAKKKAEAKKKKKKLRKGWLNWFDRD